MTPWLLLALPSLENSSHISFRQSRPKVVGTLELYHVSPFPPNQCWKISRFFEQKGKKSPDYQHWKWGEGRTCFMSQLFCLGLQLRRETSRDGYRKCTGKYFQLPLAVVDICRRRILRSLVRRGRPRIKNSKWLPQNTKHSRFARFNKLTSVFYASVLLLIINFVITLSK